MRVLAAVMACAMPFATSGCGAGGPIRDPGTLSLTPQNPTVETGQTIQFIMADNTGQYPATDFVWDVNGVVGGTAATGTITTGALYTAPATVPSPSSADVHASSNFTNSNGILFTGTATSHVKIVSATAGGPTASITATPSTINGGSSATLAWSGTNCNSGTINGATAIEGVNVGVQGSALVAPATTTTYTFTCTDSATGASATDSVTVTVVPPTGNGITVNITSPANGTTVQPGAQVVLTIQVGNDAANKGVAVSATEGTVSAVTATTTPGTFTATWTAPADVTTNTGVTLTATSIADPTASTGITIFVAPGNGGTTVTARIIPSATDIQSCTGFATFSAVLVGSTLQTQSFTFTLAPGTPGSLQQTSATSANYDAPCGNTSALSITVTANSNDYPGVSATYTITVDAATPAPAQTQ